MTRRSCPRRSATRTERRGRRPRARPPPSADDDHDPAGDQHDRADSAQNGIGGFRACRPLTVPLRRQARSRASARRRRRSPPPARPRSRTAPRRAAAPRTRSRAARPAELVALVSRAGTPRRAAARRRTWGSCRRRSPPGSVARRARPRRRRCPAPAAGAGATCGGWPWGYPSPLPRPCPDTTSPSSTNRRPSAVERPREIAGRQRLADRRGRDPVARPARRAPRPRPSARTARRAPAGCRRCPAARCPNVKFAPITACTAWTPSHQDVARRSPRPGSARTPRERQHDQHVDPRVLDQRRALRSTVVSRRGSLPGVRTSRGCRSNVIADRADAPFAGRLHRAREHRPMAEVHAVEEPDRDHRRRSPNGSARALDDLHAGQRIGKPGDGAVGTVARDGSERYGDSVGRPRARAMTVVLVLPRDARRRRAVLGAATPHERARRRRRHGRRRSTSPRARCSPSSTRRRWRRAGSGAPRARRRTARARDPRPAARAGRAGARVRGQRARLLRRASRRATPRHARTGARRELAARGLTALRPAPAAGPQRRSRSPATTAAEPRPANDLSDLAPFAPGMTFGGPAECGAPALPPGPRGRLRPAVQGVRAPRRRRAADRAGARSTARSTSALLFTTDPALRADGLVVLLEDDRGLQPAENVTPGRSRRRALETVRSGASPRR